MLVASVFLYSLCSTSVYATVVLIETDDAKNGLANKAFEDPAMTHGQLPHDAAGLLAEIKRSVWPFKRSVHHGHRLHEQKRQAVLSGGSAFRDTAPTFGTLAATTTSPLPAPAADRPKTIDEILAPILQVFCDVGSVSMMTSCFSTIVLFLVARDFSFYRLFHANQELSLGLAHLMIFLGSKRKDDERFCQATAVMLQLLYLVHGMFTLMEAVYIYMTTTNVFSRLPPMKGIWLNIFAWGFCGVFTIVTALPQYKDYPAEHSCWIDYSNYATSCTIVLPIVALFVTAFIAAEAASSGLYQHVRLPLSMSNKKSSVLGVQIGQKWLLVLIPLNLFSYLGGSMQSNAELMLEYSCLPVCSVDCALSFIMAIAHISSSEKAIALTKPFLTKLQACCSRCRGKGKNSSRVHSVLTVDAALLSDEAKKAIRSISAVSQYANEKEDSALSGAYINTAILYGR